MHSSTREKYCASQENSTFQENYLSPTWDEGKVDQGTRPGVLWKKVCFSPKTKQTLAIVACRMNDKAARSCTGNLVAAGNDRVPLTHKNSVKRCRLSAPSPHKRTWASTAHLQKHDNIHEELPPKRLRPPYFQMSKACIVRNSRVLVDLAGGGQSTSKSTCEVPARTLTAYLAIDLHPACPNRGRLEL